MRLLFDTKMTVTQKSKLLQITSYIISVYVAMFVKIHLNPRASEGPTNMIFLRYLSLDFRQQRTNLVDHCLKPVFVKHFCSWMNPINVTLNIHSKSPAFQAKQWKIPISNFLVMLLPNNLHGSEHLSGHTSDPAVKQHLASRLTTKFFLNSIDNHNRSSERWFYVIMPEWKVFAKPKKNDKLILESGDLFVTEAKTKMNEWLKKKAVS